MSKFLIIKFRISVLEGSSCILSLFMNEIFKFKENLIKVNNINII